MAIRIIDATLNELDLYTPTVEQILNFIKLLSGVGIADFLLSRRVYETVKSQLPNGQRYYLEVQSKVFMSEYTNIDRFLIPQEIAKANTICEYQLNDIREIIKLRNFSASEQVCLKGLDDLFLHDYKVAFHEIKKVLSKSKIILYPENTFHCATAIAVSFLQEAGDEVICTFSGIGNKAATEQVMIAMHTTARYKINQKFDAFSKIKGLFEEITGHKIKDNTPILGKRIFCVESGVHVDGILKNPSNYETYPPELIGQKRSIVLGKHSGGNSIRIKLRELGIEEVSNDVIDNMLCLVKQESNALGRGITKEEFDRIVKEVLGG